MIDPVLRRAASRLARLWKPMAAWSVLVWIAVGGILAPGFSLVLGWSWLRGGEEIVANEALLAWALTPRGAAWIVVAGSLALAGAVLNFAGVFEIVTEDVEGTSTSVPETALRLAPDIPALARLCAATVLAALVLAAPLVAGLAGVRHLFLSAHDVNYYLSARPPALWYALGTAGALSLAWAGGVGWLAGRSLLVLPAHVDGHRPLSAAVRRSWHGTRGGGGRVARAVGISVAAWLAARAVLDAGAVAAGSALVGWTSSQFDSLVPLVAATGGWAAASVALDAAVGFLGLAFVSTVVAELYHGDTRLHDEAPAPGLHELSGRVRDAVVRWTRPRRLFPALGLALVLSWGAGAALLERLPEPRPVAITAHRAGPPPAPENTLAALERSIDAGADWAEIDVQLTRDTVPVVLHDVDLMRVAVDPRRISRVTYGELQGVVQTPDDGSPPGERRVATLGEFLERARGRIGLMIELKYYGWDPLLARETLRALRASPGGDRMMVMSLERKAVRQLRDLATEARVGYAAAASVGDPSRLPVDFLALSRPAATAAQLRAAHRRGVDVHVWTVNRAAALAETIQRGADGVITDRPALAARIRDELVDMPAVSRLLLRFGHLLAEPWEEDRPAEPAGRDQSL